MLKKTDLRETCGNFPLTSSSQEEFNQTQICRRNKVHVAPIVVFVTTTARKDVKQIATFTAMLTPTNLHAWCTKRKPIMTMVSDLKIGYRATTIHHSTPRRQ